MVSGSLALLLFIGLDLLLGSRAGAPIRDKVLQNGKIFCTFVRSFLHLSVRPYPPLGHPAKPEAQPARPEA